MACYSSEFATLSLIDKEALFEAMKIFSTGNVWVSPVDKGGSIGINEDPINLFYSE